MQFHAEVEVDHSETDIADKDPKTFRSFLDTRPGVMEVEAIRQIIDLCRRYR